LAPGFMVATSREDCRQELSIRKLVCKVGLGNGLGKKDLVDQDRGHGAGF